MKTAVVSLKDVSNSGTLCLSPLQYVGECHRCEVFRRALHRYKSVEEAMEHLRCNPVLPEGWAEKYGEYRGVLDEKRRLEKELFGRDEEKGWELSL